MLPEVVRSVTSPAAFRAVASMLPPVVSSCTAESVSSGRYTVTVRSHRKMPMRSYHARVSTSATVSATPPALGCVCTACISFFSFR